MENQTAKKEYVIEATGQKLGRMATQIAEILRGKNIPDFEKNKIPNVSVIVNNSSKLDLSNTKLSKVYYKHSQYPGGLKSETRKHLINRLGYGEIVKKAVYGMLPANKLRARAMKNLIVKE